MVRNTMRGLLTVLLMWMLVGTGSTLSSLTTTSYTTTRPTSRPTSWTTSRPTSWTTSRTTSWPRTTAYSGVNLKEKMFTLSWLGGITLYSPSFTPDPAPPYFTSTSYPRSTPTTSTGVSVCLRYITEESYNQPIFTLSPSSSSSKLALMKASLGQYQLTLREAYIFSPVSFRSFRRIWYNADYKVWTSVCVTLDTRNHVTQMFSGGSMSVRKRLPMKYAWTGEPVIEISQFEGQVTDVQVWDYPLPYMYIKNYMCSGCFWSYHGSVLTWFDVSYTPSGDILLEDSYDGLEMQPMRRGNSVLGPMGEKKKKKGKKEKKKKEKFFYKDVKKTW